ncbi:MAG: hypothetical protein RLZZ488_2743 [Pseudomonadota bacterium]|jgi:hypothetical protein
MLIGLFFVAGVLGACLRKPLIAGKSPQLNSPVISATPAADTPESPAGLAQYLPLTERNALGARFQDSSLADLYLSLAVCDCLPKLQVKLITSLNADRGALPQALMPAVRREILGNSKLKILEIVPRPLDDFVGGIFADEQTVAKEINTGLVDKIKLAEARWAAAENLPLLQLDGFPPLPGTRVSSSGRSVRMIDVWTRWSLILSQGGPWSSERSVSNDSGLLWHELLRSLAEGEYLFGLGGSDGKSWGGLTIPVDLQINNPGPFDPRTSYSQVRFLSGQLDLTLSSNNSLSLARFGGDRWSWRESNVPLAEQATQWWVAARALNRLRPLNRGEFTTLFPTLIPDDSYQLSLLVLPSLDALLSGRFIDEVSRLIRAYISGAQVGGVAPSVRERADAQTQSLLLMAMSAWIKELSTTSDLSVSSETATQLRNAPRSLLRGAQLIVQNLLGQTLAPRPITNEQISDALFSVYANSADTSQGELSVRDHAQVLHALVSAEKNLMPSPYLRARVLQLAAGLAQRWQEARSFDPSKDPLAPLLWLKAAGELLVVTYPDAPISASFRGISSEIDVLLRSFEEAALR